MVICVVGQPGAGKDALAEHLVTKEIFSHISTGDIIREEMRKKYSNRPGKHEEFPFQNRRNEIGNFCPANIVAGRIVGTLVISRAKKSGRGRIERINSGRTILVNKYTHQLKLNTKGLKKDVAERGIIFLLTNLKNKRKQEYKYEIQGLWVEQNYYPNG